MVRRIVKRRRKVGEKGGPGIGGVTGDFVTQAEFFLVPIYEILTIPVPNILVYVTRTVRFTALWEWGWALEPNLMGMRDHERRS